MMSTVRSDPKFRDHVEVSIHPRAHRWYKEALHSAFHDTAPREARSFLSVQRGFVTRRDRADRIIAWARALRFFRDPPADPGDRQGDPEMRIVHEIHYPCQSGVSTRGPYAVSKNKKGPANDFPVEVTIVSTDLHEHAETLHLEGSASCILDMARDLIDMIENAGASMVEEGKLDEDWQRTAPEMERLIQRAAARNPEQPRRRRR